MPALILSSASGTGNVVSTVVVMRDESMLYMA